MNNKAKELLDDYTNVASPRFVTNKITQLYKKNNYQAIDEFTDFLLTIDEPGVADRTILLNIGTTITLGNNKLFTPIIKKINRAYINNGIFTNVKYENFLYSWMAHVDLSLIMDDDRIINNKNYKINYVHIFTNIITNSMIIKYIMDTPEFLELRKKIVEDGRADEIEDVFIFVMKGRYSMEKFYKDLPDEYKIGVRI